MNYGVRCLAICFIATLFVVRPASAQPSEDLARTWVASALDAMGGEAAIRNLENLRFDALSHRNLLEQSERPAGPWIPAYAETSALLDVEDQRLRTTTANKLWGFTSTLIVADSVAAREVNGRQGPGRRAQVETARERWALGPERVLLTALDARDLHAEGTTTLQGVPHHVAAFTWHDAPVRLFLNANTHLPTAVERTRAYPYDVMWNVWGDVTTRTYYSYWTLEHGGIRYPYQWDVVRNGQPFRTTLITDLVLHAAAPADSFAIADEVRAAFAQTGSRLADDIPLGDAAGRPNRPVAELEPGLVHIPGPWDVALVKQPDGVVVLEAPLSSGYSAQVLQEAGRRFPDLSVKAVVTTSDAWPHLGGIREYVAHEIPVYALDQNVPPLTRVIQAPHRMHPDALERQPHAPDFRVVAGKTTLGEGSNRMELYPVRGEAGERMMAAYFPEHRLLYASDLVQKMPDGSFWQPQYLSEIAAVVEREQLNVETVFALHTDALPWSEVLDAITEAKEPSAD